MDFKNRKRLLLDLKSASFLPSYNEDLFKQNLAYLQKVYKQMQDNLRQIRHNSEEQDSLKSEVTILLTDMTRSKRVLLAYLMYRINKIQSKYWDESGRLTQSHTQFLSNQEKEYLSKYDEMVKEYESQLDISITPNVPPPSEVFVEVRVLKQIGQIVTIDGETLDLQLGTQLLLKRSEVQQFIQEGSIIEI